MLKQKRHELIQKLIGEHCVTTQEELLQWLRESGCDVTQATVSRDIKELRLVKSMDSEGRYRYSVIQSAAPEVSPKFTGIFAGSVISIDTAMNDMVIKCYSGMANAACAALDSMQFPEIVGSLAGDDTIFVITRNEEAALRIARRLRAMLENPERE